MRKKEKKNKVNDCLLLLGSDPDDVLVVVVLVADFLLATICAAIGTVVDLLPPPAMGVSWAVEPEACLEANGEIDCEAPLCSQPVVAVVVTGDSSAAVGLVIVSLRLTGCKMVV